MASGYKNPPAFGEGDNYENWKKEIGVWRLVTDLEKKKQALAVTLSLTGQARSCALGIKTADVNKDEGLDKLIAELDKLFLADKTDLSYSAYSDFDSYRRDASTGMAEFIIEFDRRYNRCKGHDMTLPDAVLSFRLLDSAGLSRRDRQLALTAARDMKYETMKSALKRIFGEIRSMTSTDSGSGITVKQEEAMVTRDRYRHDGKNANSTSLNSSNPGTNPMNRYGRRTQCAICRSVFHWAKDCPHKSESEKVRITEDTDDTDAEEDCNLTLFTKELPTSEIFMAEALGCAVLDTACTRTVCGKKWIENYIENMSEKGKTKILRTPSKRNFRFGDGMQMKSEEKVTIPAKIGDVRCKIETEVVKAEIPLLLSKDSLKRAQTVLDMSNDKATMFSKPVNLQFTSSGHYCVDIRDNQGTLDLRDSEEQLSEVFMLHDQLSEDEKRKIVFKLHRQFGHASSDRLGRLIENVGIRDGDTKTCE